MSQRAYPQYPQPSQHGSSFPQPNQGYPGSQPGSVMRQGYSGPPGGSLGPPQSNVGYGGFGLQGKPPVGPYPAPPGGEGSGVQSRGHMTNQMEHMNLGPAG